VAWTGHPGDPELSVFHLLEGMETADVRVFRGIKRDEPVLEDFQSAFVLGFPPPRRIQRRSAVIWMGLSTYRSREAAESLLRAVPKIGTHVSELVLPYGQGLAVAETVRPGHVTVWGDPLKLANAVVNVYPVG
jgi:hypothetical protein